MQGGKDKCTHLSEVYPCAPDKCVHLSVPRKLAGCDFPFCWERLRNHRQPRQLRRDCLRCVHYLDTPAVPGSSDPADRPLLRTIP